MPTRISFYDTIREDYRLLPCPDLDAYAVSRYADVRRR